MWPRTAASGEDVLISQRDERAHRGASRARTRPGWVVARRAPLLGDARQGSRRRDARGDGHPGRSRRRPRVETESVERTAGASVVRRSRVVPLAPPRSRLRPSSDHAPDASPPAGGIRQDVRGTHREGARGAGAHGDRGAVHRRRVRAVRRARRDARRGEPVLSLAGKALARGTPPASRRRRSVSTPRDAPTPTDDVTSVLTRPSSLVSRSRNTTGHPEVDRGGGGETSGGKILRRRADRAAPADEHDRGLEAGDVREASHGGGGEVRPVRREGVRMRVRARRRRRRRVTTRHGR